MGSNTLLDKLLGHPARVKDGRRELVGWVGRVLKVGGFISMKEGGGVDPRLSVLNFWTY